MNLHCRVLRAFSAIMTETIRFTPIYQTRIWGGRRLETMLARTLPDAQPYGESWELCDRAESQSVVCGGALSGKTLHELWTQNRTDIFGLRYANHPAERFPILLKILDCVDTLSLQVHPPAALAPRFNGEPKTEMWFVAHADPGALVYAGLKRGTTRDAFEKALQDGTAAEVVHSVKPERGEFMFVESGRLHALGAGLLIYEIQQNSDTTFRVFDWNRVGLDGKPRTLHVAESLACIDFNDFEPSMQSAAADGTLVHCSYFDTKLRHLAAGQSQAFESDDAFVCVAITRGKGTIAGQGVSTGDFLLLPASLPQSAKSIVASEQMEWLEIRLP
jgi:mannose-6-phosphate isomerase